MSILDHPIVTERYFFPRRDPSANPWLVDADGETLVGARVARHGRKAILFFHGNGEVAGDWEGDFARTLDAAGVDAYFAEYRGYGGSTGRPALVALLDDALAIADATGVPAGDLVVYGRSIGSLFALHVAAHRSVGALVLESGIADLYERLAARLDPRELGITDAELRAAVGAHFDQRAKIERTTCPVLVLHAENDAMVRAHHARHLAEWAGARGELVLFEHGDHNTIHAFNGADIARRVVALAQ